MLESIEIENYKSFSHLKVEGFGKVNLIVGQNNSGKTNLLEALLMNMGAVNFNSLLNFLSMRFGYTINTTQQYLDEYKWMFRFDNDADYENIKFKSKILNVERILELQYKDHTFDPQALYTSLKDSLSQDGSTFSAGATLSGSNFPIRVDDSPITPPTSMINQNLATLQIEYKKGLNEKIVQTLKIPRSGDVQFPEEKAVTDFGGVFIGSSGFTRKPDSGVEAHDRTLKEGLKDEYLSLLTSVCPEIHDIINMQNQLHCFVNKRKKPIPFRLMGEGIRKIQFLAGHLVQCFNGAILIDEIDVHLHYKLLHQMLQWLIHTGAEKNIQIFCTTHSLEAIDTFLDVCEEKDSLVLFRMPAVGSKTQEVVRFEFPQIKRIRDNLAMDLR